MTIGYETTVLVIGLIGLMQLIQLLVADAAGIGAKKTPGFLIEPSHQKFAFRAERAFFNTNESVTIFILLACFCILCAASPSWLNGLAVTYALSRLFHMLFYYFNIKLARSGAFVVSLLALAGMCVIGFSRWI